MFTTCLTALQGVQLTPQEFEKDDDSNFHMDFITAARCANTRHNGGMIGRLLVTRCKIKVL